jgi:hypothetical protein
MKKNLLPILPFLLFILACQPSGNSNNSPASTSIKKEVEKPFSDLVKSDRFIVELTGQSPSNMSLIFSIKRYDGQEIYRQVIKAKDLIDNYKHTVDLEKETDQIKFLQEETKLFFEDENFLEPAVTPGENPDKNTEDKAFYSALKKSGLNGFKYRLSNEMKIYIAWSALENKVKIYYKCC